MTKNPGAYFCHLYAHTRRIFRRQTHTTSTTQTNCPCRRNGEQRIGPIIPQWTISGDSSHLIPNFPKPLYGS